jgi:hypothetical protein
LSREAPRDAHEPRPRAALGACVGGRGPGREERLLEHVLGVVVVADDPTCVLEDARRVALDELAERRAISGGALREQLAILVRHERPRLSAPSP